MSDDGAPLRGIESLREVSGDYDTLFCDVWGVVHDGVRQNPEAVAALRRAREDGARVVLLTNSPRPSAGVVAQLGALGVDPEGYDRVVTSGDATRAMIEAGPRRFLHIGAVRDRDLFDGLDARPVAEDEAEGIVVTGLRDDERETPEDYRALLGRLAERRLPLVCANPDIVVHRGERLIFCAGALGALYAELGGEVHLAGKPHRPIYEVASASLPTPPRRTLCIGDGLFTDVRGAANFGADCLFVTHGIHRDELADVLGHPGHLAAAMRERGVSARYMMASLR
ncbi:TIGR01459 family HAD-type hydrolase [Aureimonas sp. AU4]|uniref:TIGR01459 family HAD-type hydrolase n=1 Tax=Aureimonas sp. AU4 TaxID=1638163 RepID=UPI0007844AE4|nr:TIGR01459 family HAD-type hydrolase [Aureimonas sp. AU4]